MIFLNLNIKRNNSFTQESLNVRALHQKNSNKHLDSSKKIEKIRGRSQMMSNYF